MSYRKYLKYVVLTLLIVFSTTSYAELQNMMVHGSVRVRGNWFTSPAGPDSSTGRNPLFQWPLTNSFRPAANPLAGVRWPLLPGRLAIKSPFDWDESGHSVKYVEQRTRLSVKADFSEQVSALIEFDSYDRWGEDFRSMYATGLDGRADTNNDVEVYQSYIQATDVWDLPLIVRIGRQELRLGSGWLLGPSETDANFTGLSVDAVFLHWRGENYIIKAVYAKPHEDGPVEEDGDVDMYAACFDYMGIDNVLLETYWMFGHDGRRQADTDGTRLEEAFEDWVGLDNYDPTHFHTVGMRGAGKIGTFDFEAEVAYQFGNADIIGRKFTNRGLLSLYGDDDAEYDAWGANLELGYTFDYGWAPRVFVGGAYLGGEDKRDLNFGQWLAAVASPWYRPESSISFNRVFSNWKYSQFLDQNSDLSNVWIARAGVSASPVENITLELSGSKFETLEPYKSSWPAFTLFGQRVVPFETLTFLDKENDSDLGWELKAKAIYTYSEAMTFEAGYAHLFVGDGLEQGNFNNGNGLTFNGGTDGDDPDYFYFETKLTF